MYLLKFNMLYTYAPLQRINKYKLKFKSKPCISFGLQKSTPVKYDLLTNFINYKTNWNNSKNTWKGTKSLIYLKTVASSVPAALSLVMVIPWPILIILLTSLIITLHLLVKLRKKALNFHIIIFQTSCEWK